MPYVNATQEMEAPSMTKAYCLDMQFRPFERLTNARIAAHNQALRTVCHGVCRIALQSAHRPIESPFRATRSETADAAAYRCKARSCPVPRRQPFSVGFHWSGHCRNDAA